MTFDLEKLVRPNIRTLKPYSSARSEYAGLAEVFLDANENAFGSPIGNGLNRYPDPLQKELKARFARLRSVNSSQIFIGNGSDEAIDLLFRIFCRPGIDECIVCPPTYGMYQVSADINDIDVVEIPLTSEYQLDVPNVMAAVNTMTRLIFICSPNNPTGNVMKADDVIEILESFRGIVVIDEAYIDFAVEASFICELEKFPNLVILQTLSKAWGLAGLRLGVAYASPEIISLMNRTKPPYNVSGAAQSAALEALEKRSDMEATTAETIRLRDELRASLGTIGSVEKVFPSQANFLLVRFADANDTYRRLLTDGIVVRNRSNILLCEGCLRITVGTEEENRRLIACLNSL